MKDTLIKLYAAEKSGLGSSDLLEELICNELELSKKDLTDIDKAVVEKVSTERKYNSDYEFRHRIHDEYLKYFQEV